MKDKREKLIYILLSVMMIFIAYFPHLQSEMIQGSDDWFHFHRIYALAAELKQGIFPVKLHHLAGFGYGYGVGFFYSNFFLYIPAMLINILNISLDDAYRVFVLMVYSGIYCAMFYCIYRIAEKKEFAFGAAAIYLFTNKVMEAFYTNMALGQMCAFVFFPMAIVGMYLFLEKGEDTILLMLGFIGLIYSHTISTFLAFVICLILIVFEFRVLIMDFNKMRKIIVSVCITSLVTAAFWLPMFEQMKAQVLKVKAPWTTSEENVLNYAYIIKSSGGLGYVVVGLLIFNIIMFFKSLIKREKKENKFLFISIIMVLLTMYKPFWHFMNVDLNIKFLQFPSRLLAPTTVIIIVDTIICLKEMDIKRLRIKLLAIGVLISSIAISYSGFSEQYFDVSNEHINKVKNNEIAAFGAGEEWLPIETDRSEIIDAEIAIDNEGNQITGEKTKGYSRYFFVADLEKKYYNLPYIWYKGYCALDDNGNRYELSQNKETGMLQVYMPPNASGAARIEIYYEGTKYQRLAYLSTMIGIIVLGIYVLIHKNETKK